LIWIKRYAGRCPTSSSACATAAAAAASACRHAKWLILGVRCQDPDGTDVPRYLAVPSQDVEILDDWHALGMRGAGSFGVTLHDVFVPEHRSVPIADIGCSLNFCSLLRPVAGRLAVVLAAVTIGFARDYPDSTQITSARFF
jgi:alkylation response protein AidB-like acyl-CoA dehydrogenase